MKNKDKKIIVKTPLNHKITFHEDGIEIDWT
jgi:hypothetical protein